MLLEKMYIMLRSKNIENKIPDISNLDIKINLYYKINEVKGEIPNINNLATNASLNSKKKF